MVFIYIQNYSFHISSAIIQTRYYVFAKGNKSAFKQLRQNFMKVLPELFFVLFDLHVR